MKACANLSITAVCALLSWGVASEVEAQQNIRGCTDAARSLISASAEVRVGSGARYGLSDTQQWESVDGHQGVCRYDSSGRLYQVEITRFPAPTWGGGASYSITCESERYRRRECPLRGPAVVRLQRQLSGSSGACVEGRTFGVSGSTLWVDGGCRGVFVVGAAWEPHSLRCTSKNYRRQECATRDGSVARLVRQESSSACTEGRSWGHYGSTLWVDGGCAGLFEIAPIGGGAGGGLEATARNACRKRAESQGLQVLSDLGTRVRGRYVDVTFRTSRRGIQLTTTCTFDSTTGFVEIYAQ